MEGRYALSKVNTDTGGKDLQQPTSLLGKTASQQQTETKEIKESAKLKKCNGEL